MLIIANIKIPIWKIDKIKYKLNNYKNYFKKKC